MVGLVEKPHFDTVIFRPGIPIMVDIPRQPYTTADRFKEFCLVKSVEKDKMIVAYIIGDSVSTEVGDWDTKTILAQDVADGNVIIKFMKSIDEEEGN